jgi:hypothetical protein
MTDNKWFFQDGDIMLTSDDPQQLEMANQWILGLTQAIKQQAMEEMQNGRTELSDGYEQPELPEVTC